MYSRDEVVKRANSWIGLKESDNSYKKILDIYNAQKKLPRGVKITKGMAWCATTWSAIALSLGYEKVMPVECSCGQLIELAKKMGIWVENDRYVPMPGDAILYDWDDDGKGDCTGWPDHIGVIQTVNTKSGLMTVVEGNYNKSVGVRTFGIGGRYIRGFITPKYDTTKEPAKITVTKATEKPKKSSSKYDNFYKTTKEVNLRNGAGSNKASMVVMGKGMRVRCYKYYNTAQNGADWLYVAVTVKGKAYEGYCPLSCLKKV